MRVALLASIAWSEAVLIISGHWIVIIHQFLQKQVSLFLPRIPNEMSQSFIQEKETISSKWWHHMKIESYSGKSNKICHTDKPWPRLLQDNLRASFRGGGAEGKERELLVFSLPLAPRELARRLVAGISGTHVKDQMRFIHAQLFPLWHCGSNS